MGKIVQISFLDDFKAPAFRVKIFNMRGLSSASIIDYNYVFSDFHDNDRY